MSATWSTRAAHAGKGTDPLSNCLIAEVGEALFGPRYRTDLAEALQVNERTVRRWVDGVMTCRRA